MADLQPDSLRADRDALSVLAYSFDFELLRSPQTPDRYSVAGRQTQAHACDATEGQYASCKGSPDPVPLWIYVGTDGRAGVIALSFAELVGLVVALPYWHDILRFSARGNLDEMWRAAAMLERDTLEDFPDLPAARTYLTTGLQLPALSDPVAALHQHAVASEFNLRVTSNDGSRLSSLVGALSIADRPRWR